MRACDNQGLTPLHHSLRLGSVDCMDFLLSQEEVDVNEKCHIGNTPLHTLCSSKDIASNKQVQLCQKFVKVQGVDINSTNNDGLTALHFACYAANKDLVKTLIQNNATIKADAPSNILNYMLEDLETTNWQTRERRDDANFLACIDLLIEACPSLVHQRDPERKLLPFQMAIISRYVAAALKLIPLATDKEIQDRAGYYTSLAIAAGRGLYQVVDALLQRNADPNALNSEDSDITALQMACINDQVYPPVDFLQTIIRLAPLTDSYVLHRKNVNPFEICVDNKALESFITLATFFPPDEFTIRTNVQHHLPYVETPLGYLLRERSHVDSTLQFVERLLELGNSNVNGNACSIPCYASLVLQPNLNSTSEKILQLLVSNGAKVDAKKRSWLEEHVVNSHPRALLLLVKYGLAHLEELQRVNNEKNFAYFLTELTLGVSGKVPKSMQFLARKSLRQAIFANGVCDLRHQSLIQDLPSTIRSFVLFQDLDIEETFLQCCEMTGKVS